MKKQVSWSVSLGYLVDWLQCEIMDWRSYSPFPDFVSTETFKTVHMICVICPDKHVETTFGWNQGKLDVFGFNNSKNKQTNTHTKKNRAKQK